MCWVEFDAVVDCVHVLLSACEGGKCGIINNKYIIHVWGIENQVFGINKVFNVSFFPVVVGTSRPQFFCIKLVPLVIFIYYARTHIHQIYCFLCFSDRAS